MILLVQFSQKPLEGSLRQNCRISGAKGVEAREAPHVSIVPDKTNPSPQDFT